MAGRGEIRTERISGFGLNWYRVTPPAAPSAEKYKAGLDCDQPHKSIEQSCVRKSKKVKVEMKIQKSGLPCQETYKKLGKWKRGFLWRDDRTENSQNPGISRKDFESSEFGPPCLRGDFKTPWWMALKKTRSLEPCFWWTLIKWGAGTEGVKIDLFFSCDWFQITRSTFLFDLVRNRLIWDHNRTFLGSHLLISLSPILATKT